MFSLVPRCHGLLVIPLPVSRDRAIVDARRSLGDRDRIHHPAASVLDATRALAPAHLSARAEMRRELAFQEAARLHEGLR